MAAFLAQTYQLEGAAGTITVVGGRLARVQTAAERIARLLDEKVRPWSHAPSSYPFYPPHSACLAMKPSSSQLGSVKWPDVLGEVTFRDVAFAYPSRPGFPVLRGVSFVAPAGSVTAGEHGGGSVGGGACEQT